MPIHLKVNLKSTTSASNFHHVNERCRLLNRPPEMKSWTKFRTHIPAFFSCFLLQRWLFGWWFSSFRDLPISVLWLVTTMPTIRPQRPESHGKTLDPCCEDDLTCNAFDSTTKKASATEGASFLADASYKSNDVCVGPCKSLDKNRPLLAR